MIRIFIAAHITKYRKKRVGPSDRQPLPGGLHRSLRSGMSEHPIVSSPGSQCRLPPPQNTAASKYLPNLTSSSIISSFLLVVVFPEDRRDEHPCTGVIRFASSEAVRRRSQPECAL